MVIVRLSFEIVISSDLLQGVTHIPWFSYAYVPLSKLPQI